MTVLTPTNGQVVGSNYAIYGTVSDESSGVSKLYIKYGTNDYSEVTVSNGFWATNIEAGTAFGTNTNLVYAVDGNGNASSPAFIQLNRQPVPVVWFDATPFGKIVFSSNLNISIMCTIDAPDGILRVDTFVMTNNATNYQAADWMDPNWKFPASLQPDSNWIIASGVSSNNISNFSAPLLVIRDIVGPVPGSGGLVSNTVSHETTLAAVWQKAMDNYTPQNGILYRMLLVKTNDNTTNANTNWFTDITGLTGSNLTVNTTYRIYVQSRDSVGNSSNYQVLIRTTPDETPPVPANSGTITIADRSSNSFKMIWERATDNVTFKGKIEYRVVLSTYSNLNTPSQAEANGTVISNWAMYSIDTVTNVLTGLTGATTYYVNVIARDETTNKAVYVCTRATTTSDDDPPPVPGNSGIIFASKSGNSASLSWTKASDVNTPQSSLQYRVYYSPSANLDSYSNIITNGTDISGGWNTDISNWTYGPLSEGWYYFNVLVKDLSGNISIYSMVNYWHSSY